MGLRGAAACEMRPALMRVRQSMGFEKLVSEVLGTQPTRFRVTRADHMDAADVRFADFPGLNLLRRGIKM